MMEMPKDFTFTRQKWFKRLSGITLLIIPFFIMFLAFAFHQFEVNYFPLAIHNDDVTTVVYRFTGEKLGIENPVKIGYSFNGWHTNAQGTELDKDQMPGHAHDIYAKWTPNDYVLSFPDTPLNSITVIYDQPIGDLPEFTREGYTFIGWEIDETPILSTTKWTYTSEKQAIAVWEIQHFDIYYEVNGGSTIDIQTYTYNASIQAPTAPTRAGYIFAGWYLDRTFYQPYSFYKMPASSLTLYAKWTTNSYLVQFEENGGSTVSNLVLPYGASSSLPTPTREGYTFVGWYSDNALEVRVTEVSSISASLYLYAKWTPNLYWIHFDSNQGTTINSQSVVFNNLIDLPSNPVRDHFYFVGWYIDESLTTIINFTKMPSRDIVLYGKWLPLDYSLTYVIDEILEQTEVVTFGYNQLIIEPEQPIKTGYTFGGWFEDLNLDIPYSFGFMPGENVYLYAKWNINQYTISFSEDGGSAVTDITQDYGTNVSAPNTPTKTGYTFNGWYSNAELTTTYTFTTMPAQSITLYAKWTINQYTISFSENGGSTVTDISQNYGTNVTAPTAPTKTGYTFGGWYSDVALTTLYSFTTMPAQNITIYAKWAVNQYTIAFSEEGGSTVSNITQDYASSVIAPSAPTKEGYTFGGWFSDVELTTTYTFTTIPAQNITIYAKWTINQYTISFVENGGSTVSDITQDYASSVTAPTSPTKVGYAFGGWYTDVALTQLYIFGTMPANEETLYAKWNINQYTISFYEDGGSTVTNITQNYGTNVVEPTAPTKEGYTFSGWYIDVGLTNAYMFTTMPANSLILFAKWEIII